MILVIEQRVRDFGEWKRAFVGHRAVQERHGMTGYAIYRDDEDPALVTVLADFPVGAAVRGYLDEPSLGEVLGAGGIEGRTNFRFRRKIEEVDLRRDAAA
jgi:hypothetical protein